MEHIPKDVIIDIFCDFGRLASDHAVMSHYIDMAGHYHYFDPSITVYNFLRYNERKWAWFNNDIQYQNRLRMSDFRCIHEAGGWPVATESPTCGSVEDLRSIPLAPEFRHYTETDLQIYGAWITSTPSVSSRDEENQVRLGMLN